MWEFSGVCDNLFQTARNSLILNRRDAGVVDQARLESAALEQCGDVLIHIFRSRFNDLTPERSLSVSPRK